MNTISQRPIATPPYSVAQQAPHQILVCKACKYDGLSGKNGNALMKQLRSVVSNAGLDPVFEVVGTACLAGCVPEHGRGCVVALRAATKASWMFGGIDPAKPLDDLAQFSKLYAALDDGWCSGKDCGPRLCANTLARIPAAIIATHESRAP